jgi:hypothetical protein
MAHALNWRDRRGSAKGRPPPATQTDFAPPDLSGTGRHRREGSLQRGSKHPMPARRGWGNASN